MKAVEEVKHEGDFRKKREEYSFNKRRQHRFEVFEKKRNQHTSTNADSGSNTNFIIDDRFADSIQKFINTNYHVETLTQLFQAAFSNDPLQKHYGLIGVRKLMSTSSDPPIQKVIDIGFIPKLIQYMQQQQFPQLQLQATWALTNVASGTHQQCQSIVDKSVIPLFIKALKSRHIGIVEQAIWGIGNIATDTTLSRNAIIRQGGIENMIFATQNAPNEYIFNHCIWALSNICRGSPLPEYKNIKTALFFLVETLVSEKISDEDTLSDTIWAIAYNMNTDKERIDDMLRLGIHTVIVKLISHDKTQILVGAIRILARITYGTEAQLQLIMNQPSLLNLLGDLINHTKQTVRLESCWVIGNIASGRPQYVDELISREQIITSILHLFESDSDEVKDEICYIFSNMVKQGEPERVFNFLKEVNIIKYYLSLLSNDNVRLVKTAISELGQIVKFGERFKRQGVYNYFVNEILNLGGCTILEDLQLHDDKDIYNMVVEFIQNYFEEQTEPI